MTPRSYYRLDTLLVSRDVLAVHAHRKRRHHHPGADGYERHLPEAVPGRRGRAQRRTGGPRGRLPAVWVHIRWVVPQDRPRRGLRDLTGSRDLYRYWGTGTMGKGLTERETRFCIPAEHMSERPLECARGVCCLCLACSRPELLRPPRSVN